MKAWLMDAYRCNNSIILWVKTNEDIRIKIKYKCFIYLDTKAEKFLLRNKIPYILSQKLTYLRKWKKVLQVQAPVDQFNLFIRFIEHGTKYRVSLYNADIPPEQMYLYENNLVPLTKININDGISIHKGINKNDGIGINEEIKNDYSISLKKLFLEVKSKKDIYLNPNCQIESIIFNNEKIEGNEESVLKRFTIKFINKSPDVIYMVHAFSTLPYLVRRLEYYGLKCPFHRWDDKPINYIGGKSFYSYGQVYYRDFAIRLNGRFLVDTDSTIGRECDVDAIIELCHLSGNRFQQVASRSFGAVFQSALVREIFRHNYLVPFKEKPIEDPINLIDLLKSDRAGHTFDPKIGFQKNVAEIDFCSMFPWLIYNHNISADTILYKELNSPYETVPDLPIQISLHHKGLVPIALKPFLDKRMEYKRNPTRLNIKRAAGLKWVLVSCYGYLRFREFKLGLPSSHQAICAYAREKILEAANLAEDHGYEIVHGIVDSLYVRKKGMNESDLKELCKDLEALTGIPISLKGIFKWVVFLPRISDSDIPVPARYYGVFNDNTIKARGIEVRQRSSPFVVRNFQRKVLEELSICKSKREIMGKVTELCKFLRQTIIELPNYSDYNLAIPICLGKTEYKHNIPQKKIVNILKKKGVRIMPGQIISFVFQRNKIVLSEDYNGKPDIDRYKRLLIRSLYIVLQPFGIRKNTLLELSGTEKQTKIQDFYFEGIPHYYIPIPRKYSSRKGLSERYIKSRLEKSGWIVWRGGLINILKRNFDIKKLIINQINEIYPNVRKKYQKLLELLSKAHSDSIEHLQYLCAVHHGMPDFICYRNGKFKFIECKLGHEQVSKRQKICIGKLIKLGFNVEIHKLAEITTKTIRMEIDYSRKEKRVLEKQLIIT